MSDFISIDPSTATGDTKDALNLVEAAFNSVPNLMRKIAASPGTLKGVMTLNQAVNHGALSLTLVEQIALLTSRLNQCEYCVAVHVQVGQQLGLSRDELIGNLQGVASDETSQAVLNFTNELVNKRGQASQASVRKLRDLGLTDQAIIEIVGVVGLYTMLNYLKHLTEPALDFPAVKEFQPEKVA